jgi:hypothetical protein
VDPFAAAEAVSVLLSSSGLAVALANIYAKHRGLKVLLKNVADEYRGPCVEAYAKLYPPSIWRRRQA